MLADRIRIVADRREDLASVGELDCLHAVGNRQQGLQVEGRNGCGRLAAMLSIGDSHRCQFRMLALADAELDAPAEDQACRDFVAPANRRRTDAGLLSLHHDRKLLGVREAAPVRPSVARRSSSRGVCQAVFDQLFVSSAASTTAYPPPDTRTKTGAPGTQAVDRDAMPFGVSLGGQSAPAQRLDMHRPECLDGLVVLVLGYRLARALAQLAGSDTGQFQHVKRPQPAAERATVQSIVAAIFGTAHATSTPCLDVDRPKGTTCLVLEVSLSHRRSSIMRRNPISFASAPPNRCAKPGRLPPTERWQDKSREVRAGRVAEE